MNHKVVTYQVANASKPRDFLEIEVISGSSIATTIHLNFQSKLPFLRFWRPTRRVALAYSWRMLLQLWLDRRGFPFRWWSPKLFRSSAGVVWQVFWRVWVNESQLNLEYMIYCERSIMGYLRQSMVLFCMYFWPRPVGLLCNSSIMVAYVFRIREMTQLPGGQTWD